MFVKIVLQGSLGSPASPHHDGERTRKALRAAVDRFEVDMAERMRAAVDAAAHDFDCVMCFVWHASEAGEDASYARMVRRDRVFEVSGRIDLGRVREADVASTASAVIRFALQSAAEGLAKRGLAADVRAVLENALAAP